MSKVTNYICNECQRDIPENSFDTAFTVIYTEKSLLIKKGIYEIVNENTVFSHYCGVEHCIKAVNWFLTTKQKG